MLSELKLLTLAQLEKAAIDSGFDVVGGLAYSLMSFRSSQCPLKIWLGILDAQPLVGLSMANVAAELDRPCISAPLSVEDWRGSLQWISWIWIACSAAPSLFREPFQINCSDRGNSRFKRFL